MVPRKFYRSMLLSGFIVISGCDGVSPKQNEQVKTNGTMSSDDFDRPLIAREADLKVSGCCTLLTKSATVRILPSDSFVAQVMGDQFDAELSFGFHENDDDHDAGEHEAMVIDGVPLKHYSMQQPDISNRHLWTAEVPLKEAARRRGIVNPTLKIDGTCQSKISCDRLKSLVSSIRF